jgi:DUF917 family protein
VKKFKLEIDLGNEAMNSSEALAAALEDVAARLRATFPTKGNVRDVNGNKVGSFQLSGVRHG